MQHTRPANSSPATTERHGAADVVEELRPVLTELKLSNLGRIELFQLLREAAAR